MGQVLDCSKCCTNADEDKQEINDENGAKRISQQPNYADTSKRNPYNDYGNKSAATQVSFQSFNPSDAVILIHRRKIFLTEV